MERGTLVVQGLPTLAHTLLTSAQCTEVFSSLGNHIAKESKRDAAHGLSICFDIEEHFTSDGCRIAIHSIGHGNQDDQSDKQRR